MRAFINAAPILDEQQLGGFVRHFEKASDFVGQAPVGDQVQKIGFQFIGIEIPSFVQPVLRKGTERTTGAVLENGTRDGVGLLGDCLELRAVGQGQPMDTFHLLDVVDNGNDHINKARQRIVQRKIIRAAVASVARAQQGQGKGAKDGGEVSGRLLHGSSLF